MTQYWLSVVVEKDADGYIQFYPDLDGCHSQGDTCEELMDNIHDAIQLYIPDRLSMGEERESNDHNCLL